MEYSCIHNHQSQFLEWFGNVTETTSLSSLIAESYPGEWGKEAKNNNGVKVLRTTNFQNNGHIDYSDVIVRYIEQKKIEKKCLRTGDIILERSGGTKDNPVGRVVLFEAEGEYMFNNFTQLLRPIKSVNPYYLFFYLHTSYNADKASMRAMASQTTGIQNLNMTDYMAKEIPLPSLEEQEQFERLYRQADKSKFDGFKSQFLEMFGKVDSISTLENALSETFPGEWGNEPSSTNTIKVIRTTNFTNEGRLDLSEVIEREIDSKKVSRKKLKKGDTILERSGGTKDNPVGRVVFFDEEGDYLFNNFTQVLRPKEDVNPVYLFYTLYNSYNLNKAAMRAMASQTTGIQNLSMTEYLSKQIKLPSRELQDQFEEIYRQADKSKYYVQNKQNYICHILTNQIQ